MSPRRGWLLDIACIALLLATVGGGYFVVRHLIPARICAENQSCNPMAPGPAPPRAFE